MKTAAAPPVGSTGTVTAFAQATIDLISRPFVVEVLAALDEADHTLASLRRYVRIPRLVIRERDYLAGLGLFCPVRGAVG